ncbi:YlcG family protein [Lelliottia wanjuensis]|uniref:YlcG family protein n=1 Tax=Lelliottia wanjuensis TaxID=3050585 RepID=UPI0039083F4D
MLARECHALICADRYLADRDEKRDAGYQLIVAELQKEWSWLRLCRFSGSVTTDYRILRNYAARLMKELKK